MALPSRKIALDTNMLTASYQFRAGVFDQLKELYGRNLVFVVPEQVREELKVLEGKNAKMKRAVRIARQLMEKNKVKTEKAEGQDADSALLRLAGKGLIIATNDKELKKEVKRAGGRVVFLRKKRFVEVG